MKAVLGLFFLIAVFMASSAAELYEIKLLGNHLEDLVKETLEYVRSLLKKHDPLTVPYVPQLHLVDKDIVDLVVSGSDIKVSKAADFTVDTIKVDPLRLKADFQVTLPTVHAEGNYKISGKGWEKNVQGTGTFKLDVSNFVQSGHVELGIVDHSLQIKELTLGFSIADFKINVEGLSIEGMTQEEINELLNVQFLNYINNNKDLVAQETAAYVTELVNTLLKGHSLIDVISWLERLVASTPDPFGP